MSAIQRTILLVEDDVLIAMNESQRLRSFGYHVLTANNGEKAIDMVGSSTTIDLILMDIDLGAGISGPEAAQLILGKKTLPIVFLTSHNEKEMVEKVRGITRYGYVIKNSGDFVLQSSIEMAWELFDQKQREQEQRRQLQLSNHQLIDTTALLEGVFESSDIPMVLIALPELRIRIANPASLKQLGFDTKGSLLGLPLSKLEQGWKEFDSNGAVCDFEDSVIVKATKGITSSNAEVLFENKSGIQSWALVNASPLFNNQDAQIAAFIAFPDISEQKRSKEVIRESEQSLSITLNSIGDGVIACDIDGRVTRMNKVAEKLTAWNLADARGRFLHEVFVIVNAETQTPVENPVKLVLARGEIVGLANHTVLIGRDGSRYHIADSAAAIKDEQGQVQGVILVFSDVTERYVAEKMREELRAHEVKFKHVFDSIPMGMYLYELRADKQLIFVGYNPAADAILGLDHSQFLTKTIEEAFPSLTATTLPDQYRSLASDGGWWHQNLVDYDQGGIKGAFDCYAFQIEPHKMVVMFVGITERLKTEQALSESEQKYRTLVESSQDLIWECDLEGNYVYLNPAWEITLGYTKEEMLGQHFTKFLEPEQIQADLAAMTETLEQGQINAYEAMHVHKNGKPVQLIFSARHRRDKEGRVCGTSGTASDVTERKQAAAQIKRLLDDKTLLLKEVHHRIKNNMGTVASLLSLQAMQNQDPAVKQVFDDAKNRVQSMLVLYELLYQSENLMVLSLKDYINGLIDKLTDIYSFYQNIKIVCTVEDILVDVKKIPSLGIIINELITNSVKYAFVDMEQGLIELKAVKHGRRLEIKYSDNGSGRKKVAGDVFSPGFGMQLIEILLGQLDADCELSYQNGTHYQISLEL